MDLQEAVTSVSKKIFPGLTRENMKGVRVLSNLPLQMTLYFNVTIFPVWACVITIFLYKNFSLYGEFYRYISVTLVATVFVVEIARLYLGYEGNLKDKIPELAGFWMLSLLLQFPLQGFLLFNPYFRMYVIEYVLQTIMFSMVCIELITGYVALRTVAREQAKTFKTKGTDEDVEKED